ncbi:MAG TPA: hypothetical protein VG889_21335 [Rhizomicrobium sp.]|nr:hypothetical protein [Rhizomicrobium sp.]
MSSDLFWTVLLILGAIALASPWSIRRIQGFDARNRARIDQERSDRGDGRAHFRHTLKLAEEQVETVSSIAIADERTGQPVTRWLFEGEQYASEAEAKAAREERMVEIARGFYVDLPRALAARREEERLG